MSINIEILLNRRAEQRYLHTLNERQLNIKKSPARVEDRSTQEIIKDAAATYAGSFILI